MIARGMMLGPNQPVILHMLDIEPAVEALKGVKMELIDAAFPLLRGMFFKLFNADHIISYYHGFLCEISYDIICVYKMQQVLLLLQMLLKLAKMLTLQLWLVDFLGKKEWKEKM